VGFYFFNLFETWAFATTKIQNSPERGEAIPPASSRSRLSDDQGVMVDRKRRRGIIKSVGTLEVLKELKTEAAIIPGNSYR